MTKTGRGRTRLFALGVSIAVASCAGLFGYRALTTPSGPSGPPRYAAAAFYRRLMRLPGWQTLSVTVAAQAVQHSAKPDGYAQWDPQARALASALTGEVPAAFSCRASVPHPATPAPAAMTEAMVADLGSAQANTVVSPSRGWLISGWFIAHAQLYGISTVTFEGLRWSAADGTWAPHPPSLSMVQING